MAKFEEHLTQLETVVERLERGDLSLDESVRLFEDGMKLSQCMQGGTGAGGGPNSGAG